MKSTEIQSLIPV